jgi:hypothetical protein
MKNSTFITMLMFLASPRLVSCPGHEGTRAPHAGAVEDCQLGCGTEYVGVAHLPFAWVCRAESE